MNKFLFKILRRHLAFGFPIEKLRLDTRWDFAAALEESVVNLLPCSSFVAKVLMQRSLRHESV